MEDEKELIASLTKWRDEIQRRLEQFKVTVDLAEKFDVRGLKLNHSGFNIIFYRQLPDDFKAALLNAGVELLEQELDDDDRGTQYLYYYK